VSYVRYIYKLNDHQIQHTKHGNQTQNQRLRYLHRTGRTVLLPHPRSQQPYYRSKRRLYNQGDAHQDNQSYQLVLALARAGS